MASDLEPAGGAAIALAAGLSVAWHEPGYPTFENEVPQVFADLRGRGNSRC